MEGFLTAEVPLLAHYGYFAFGLTKVLRRLKFLPWVGICVLLRIILPSAKRWGHMDLNHEPSDYESDALTNWAMAPIFAQQKLILRIPKYDFEPALAGEGQNEPWIAIFYPK